MKRLLLFSILFLGYTYTLFASHIRAADIYAVRLNSVQYEIVLTVYTDASRVNEFEELDEPSAILYFERNSDENKSPKPVIAPRTSKTTLNSSSTSVFKNVYKYTYTAQGSNSFQVSYIGINRNFDIKNLGQGTNSGDFNIYLELNVTHEASIENSTPILTIPPLDNAATNALYSHNPGGYDVDGDFLVYRMIQPRYVESTTTSPLLPETVPNYRDPADPSFGSGSSFQIDSLTGQITWDTPLQPGEYNIAFTVSEIRELEDGTLLVLSTSVRDMQIFVEESDNKPPILELPPNKCISAGKVGAEGLIDTIIAYDPDPSQSISKLVSLGIFSQVGTMKNLPEVQKVSSAQISWFPDCNEVRKAPYQFTFKAEDTGSPRLSAIENFFVTVIGVAPQNLKATPNQTEGNIGLTWDNYLCEVGDAVIEVYRSECDSGNIVRSECVSGVPDEWGFALIDSVNINATSYTDVTAKSGGAYCYLIAAKFPGPSFGESYASDLACASIDITSPLITNVDVLSTDNKKGEIKIDWNHFDIIDTTIYLKPYRFELFRSDDIDGENFNPTPIFVLTSDSIVDSSYIDKDLNTLENPYSYRLDFYSEDNFVGSSSSNSSTWLNTTPGGQYIDLLWENSVSWYFPDTLYQYVYMDSIGDGNFFLYDSLTGGNVSEKVINLTNDKEYCFYIETNGIFCGDSLGQIITSRSQISCAIPNDTIPPCPPILGLDSIFCQQIKAETPDSYEHNLSWNDRLDPECEKDIVGYNIYYKNQLSDPYEFVEYKTRTNIQPETWKHSDLDIIAACYQITALDGSGNESIPSNQVCQDNCPYIEFPNVFTPNGDSKNDFFIPFPQPRFIEKVTFTVYNRWGKKIHESVTDSGDVKWDGKTENGEPAVTGTYYYHAEVEYLSIYNAPPPLSLNGWIHIVY